MYNSFLICFIVDVLQAVFMWNNDTSSDDQNRFLLNETSGEIKNSPPQEERELRTVHSLGGTAWREHLDDNGSSYWYNKTQQTITYSEPMHSVGDEVSNTAAPECIICMDRQCCVLLMPCLHANYCRECADRLTECPQCKAVITHRQRFYM